MEERGTSLRDLPRLLSPSLMVEPEEQRVAVETFSFLFFLFFFFFPSLVFFFSWLMYDQVQMLRVQ
jgi:hypothetical protein